jgi:hypothetical protein
MLFKQFFLLNEDIAKDTEAHGDVLYPSIAGDYAPAVSDPTEFWWLQWRWKHDKKLGRKFYNIDELDLRKRQYVALQSTDMPESDEWINKKDKSSAQKVFTHKTLHFRKIGKDSKDHEMLPNKGYFSIDGQLERYFKDKESGNWPEMAEDSDWTKYKLAQK